MNARWNLNNHIRFKLSGYGRHIWDEDIAHTEQLIGRRCSHSRSIDTSQEMRLQMHEFMRIFGAHFHMGGRTDDIPLVTMYVVIEGVEDADASSAQAKGGE